MSRPTLEQVAKKARVSISTVSRVLNGKDNVNEATRRRILSILANTDYATRELMPIHYIGVDHAEVSRRAAAFLFKSGYRRLGLLAGDPGYVSHSLYVRGFQEAHQQAGIKFDPASIETIELSAEEGFAGTQRQVSRRPKPDALIVPSDRSALGALKALRDLKMRVPDDIGLLVLDGTRETAFANPPLTSIDVPWYDMLALGTTVLIKMIDDKLAVEKIGIRFATNLVVRESTHVRKQGSEKADS